jgi:4-hydroxy-2-oxoheptanedioate aldolase
MPARINRAVDLLEQGQPVYYTGTSDLSYESGKKMARTWADYINVSLEHGAFDLKGLEQFMRGLVDGGPTASGHRTPAVVVDLPVEGTSEEVVRANSWMFKQTLARGVHGILLCHAEDPAAIRAFVECCRYSFRPAEKGLSQGRRGNGGQGWAAPVWGLSAEEYLERADPWPFNPRGELLLGIKIENVRALGNAEESARVPGLAFAEWGPGDMTMSHGFRNYLEGRRAAAMQEARTRVFAACRAAGLRFLDGVDKDTIVQRLDEGVMICSTPSEEVARLGRGHIRRTMAV